MVLPGHVVGCMPLKDQLEEAHWRIKCLEAENKKLRDAYISGFGALAETFNKRLLEIERTWKGQPAESVRISDPAASHS